MEDYPNLKADTTMIEAMKTYHQIEAGIAASRISYNSAVESLNTMIDTFPNNLVAPIRKSIERNLL